MPFVEVFTREELDDRTRERLAQGLSDTMETVEFSRPTENCRTIDWMWFHTLPADRWAVGGRFDDAYVKGRKMAFARIVTPEALMNPDLKEKAMQGVAKALREALGVGPEDDASGIWVICVEVQEGLWLVGDKVAPVLPLIDFVAGDVSPARREAIDAKFKGQEECREEYCIPY